MPRRVCHCPRPKVLINAHTIKVRLYHACNHSGECGTSTPPAVSLFVLTRIVSGARRSAMGDTEPTGHISRFQILFSSLFFFAQCCVAANGRPKELQRRNILLQNSGYVTSANKASSYKSWTYTPWHGRRSYACYNINRVASGRPGCIGQRSEPTMRHDRKIMRLRRFAR